MLLDHIVVLLDSVFYEAVKYRKILTQKSTCLECQRCELLEEDMSLSSRKYNLILSYISPVHFFCLQREVSCDMCSLNGLKGQVDVLHGYLNYHM